MLASLGGLVLGAGLVSYLARRRERAWMRRQVEIDTRVRRVVLPVLERRADVLAIPSAKRGSNDDGALRVALTLAEAIKSQEESVDLPFGDTVEVAREELARDLSPRPQREDA